MTCNALYSILQYYDVVEATLAVAFVVTTIPSNSLIFIPFPLIFHCFPLPLSLPQVTQWSDVMSHFSQTANLLTIDLVGHGQSETPNDWESYTLESLVADIEVLATEFSSLIIKNDSAGLKDPPPPSQNSNTTTLLCQPTSAQPITSSSSPRLPLTLPSIVLVSHSYGASLAVHLAPRLSPFVKALALISPSTPTNPHIQSRVKFLSTPDFLLNFYRWWDRRGGLFSHSVNRYVNSSASTFIRSKQLYWNTSSQTPVVKRMIQGCRFPGAPAFTSLAMSRIPILLIGGQGDKVTPPQEMAVIHSWLTKSHEDLSKNPKTGKSIYPSPYLVPEAGHSIIVECPELVIGILTKFLIERCGLETISLQRQIQMETSQSSSDKWR